MFKLRVDYYCYQYENTKKLEGYDFVCAFMTSFPCKPRVHLACKVKVLSYVKISTKLFFKLKYCIEIV